MTNITLCHVCASALSFWHNAKQGIFYINLFITAAQTPRFAVPTLSSSMHIYKGPVDDGYKAIEEDVKEERVSYNLSWFQLSADSIA